MILNSDLELFHRVHRLLVVWAIFIALRIVYMYEQVGPQPDLCIKEEIMLRTTQLKIFIAGAALLIATLACGAPLRDTSSTPDISAAFTQAAQTIAVQLTQAATPAATLAPTQAQNTAVSPSATLPPTQVQPTAVPPSAVPPSPTSRPPTPTATPFPCDWAGFVRDVTIRDNTTFLAGTSFTKTWRLSNEGTCTWNSNYSLVFISGNSMSGATVVPLAGTVRPGETVDVSVDLKAPTREGTHKGNWMLRNPSGGLFGIGDNRDEAFWVQIKVFTAAANPNYRYDLAANYCNASWGSSAGSLPCAGAEGDPDGFVQLLSNPELELRTENELALWMSPGTASGAWILGKFPAFNVRDGDHFLSEIGCLAGSTGCDVTFQLQYQIGNGAIQTLGTWYETYDGRTQVVDVDLSSLAGKDIKLILSAVNKGKAKNPNAFWFVPHVSKVEPKTRTVLTWHKESGDLGCQELRINITGTTSGEAIAYRCGGDGTERGRLALSSVQLNMILNWVRTYKSFDAEMTQGDDGPGTILWISFQGQGTSHGNCRYPKRYADHGCRPERRYRSIID